MAAQEKNRLDRAELSKRDEELGRLTEERDQAQQRITQLEAAFRAENRPVPVKYS